MIIDTRSRKIFRAGKKEGRKIEVKNQKGKVVRVLTLHKGLPHGCRTAKRICIQCLKNVIRKNDLNYDLKICKECVEG